MISQLAGDSHGCRRFRQDVASSMPPSLPAEPHDPVDPTNDRFRAAFEQGLLAAWICDLDAALHRRQRCALPAAGSLPRAPGRAVTCRSSRIRTNARRKPQDAGDMLAGERDGATREKRLLGADGRTVWVLAATRLIRDARRRAALLRRSGQRPDRVPPARAAAAAPRRPRSAHGPAQPARLRSRAATPRQPADALRHQRCAADARPRQLQGLQRRPRPLRR